MTTTQTGGRGRLGAAAVIMNTAGHVLLVKHTYGRLNWELPGGLSEAHESIVATAVREVREETGLQVTAQHTTGIYYEPASDLLHFVFLCAADAGQYYLRPDGDEVSRAEFWPPGALPRPISDFTVRRIEDALAGTQWPLPGEVPPRRWFE